LEAAVIDVDYFALENMYETNYADDAAKGVVGLIHIGAQNTSISLLQDGVSTFTGDLSIGGAYFTEALASQTGLSLAAAENFKLTGTAEENPSLNLAALVQPIADELAEEIRRTVSLYGAVPSDDGDGLKILFLSGGGARLTGLRVLLEERMGVPVRLSEPFRRFSVGKNIDRDYLLDSAPTFAVAAGLAIRRPGDR
jgi:type IV pilus assembly protein PilM